MKKALAIILVLSALSCSQHQPSQSSTNKKAMQDTSKPIDDKKKSMLNHRY